MRQPPIEQIGDCASTWSGVAGFLDERGQLGGGGSTMHGLGGPPLVARCRRRHRDRRELPAAKSTLTKRSGLAGRYVVKGRCLRHGRAMAELSLEGASAAPQERPLTWSGRRDSNPLSLARSVGPPRARASRGPGGAGALRRVLRRVRRSACRRGRRPVRRRPSGSARPVPSNHAPVQSRRRREEPGTGRRVGVRGYRHDRDDATAETLGCGVRAVIAHDDGRASLVGFRPPCRFQIDETDLTSPHQPSPSPIVASHRSLSSFAQSAHACSYAGPAQSP